MYNNGFFEKNTIIVKKTMTREVNEVREEFANGLMDLTVNNKALINMFTMLAEDHIAFAEVIVDTIEDHLKKVPNDHKLVVLYLIDSIVKNVGQVYKELFAKDIVQSFCNVFERVDEKTRIQMYKLRHTWMEVFSTTKLYALDCKVHSLDPAWPIIPFHSKSSIHVNPKFLTTSNDTEDSKTEDEAVPATPVVNKPVEQTAEDRTWLMKQAKLLKLQQRKLELEIEKVHIETQQKQLSKKANNAISLIKPEAIRELEETKENEEAIHNSIKTTTANTVNMFPSNQTMKTSPIDPRLSKGSKTALVYQQLKNTSQSSENLIQMQTQLQSQQQETKQEVNFESQEKLNSRLVKIFNHSESELDVNIEKPKQFALRHNGLVNGHDFHIDVDLRRVISNKRASIDYQKQDSTIKKKIKIKSKYDNQTNEDVNMHEMVNEENETITSKPQAPPPPKISNNNQLDSLRAKLAIVENVKKSSLMNSDEIIIDPQQMPFEDMSLSELISQSTEKLKKGLITADDMSNIVQEFMMSKEKEKLEEAQEKDGDSDLQPISDDELIDFSNSDDSNNDEIDSNIIVEENMSNDNKSEQNNERFRKNNNRRYFNCKKWQYLHCRNILIKNKNENNINYKNNNNLSNNIERKIFNEVTNVNELKPYNYRIKNPPNISAYSTRLLPPVNEILVSFIEKDTMRTIIIDGMPREIRFYGDTAVIFLNWDDPREISFYNGARRVTFNQKDSYLMTFNEPFRDIMIDGHIHKVRVGAPTRELFIDNKWYESVFGGPEFLIKLNDKMCSVILDGPPPQVKISENRRTDLVIGKINLIVDAQKIIPIFLDAKPQKVEIDDRIFTFRFANALKTVLINETPFHVEFGGLPKPILIGNKKHFIRFSVLPIGVEPGLVRIVNMEEWLTDTSNVPYANTICPKLNEKSLTEDNINSDNSCRTNLDDILSSAVSSSMAPSINRCYNIGNSPANRSISPIINQTKISSPNLNSPVSLQSSSDENQQQSPKKLISGPQSIAQSTTQSTAQSLPVLGNININELFRKLVANGIIPQSHHNNYVNGVKNHKSKQEIEQESLPKHQWLKRVSFEEKGILKIRNGSFINSLYTGVQCSTCGIRFLPSNTLKYSEHLDWHFSKNRAQRELSKTPLNRQWYLIYKKWIESSLLDNLNSKEKNWTEIAQDMMNNKSINTPSVPSNTNYHIAQMCVICYDEFIEFYNEDEEEWHLRDALRINNKLYHPFCYKDHIQSLSKKNSPVECKQEHDSSSDIQLLFDNNAIMHDNSKLSNELIKSTNDMNKLNNIINLVNNIRESSITRESSDSRESSDTRESSNDANKLIIDVDKIKDDEQCNKDVDADDTDDNVLIIEEFVPKQKNDDDKLVIDIIDDDSVKLDIKPVESESMLIDVRDIKTEIDFDSDNEMKSEGYFNFDDAQSEDEEDITQKQMMNVNYTFDGDEMPQKIPNKILTSELKITISESLLSNSRQTNLKLSDISDDSSIDDIIIEKEVPYRKLNREVTLQPVKLKPMLRDIPLKKFPIVSKSKEETSICSLM